jgi:hypothetical protein
MSLFKVNSADLPDVKQGGKKAKPRKLVSVFDHYKQNTLAGLNKALVEAEGRFGTPSSAPRPDDSLGASTMWRIVGKKNAGKDEVIAISLKVGNRNKLPIFPKMERVKVDGRFEQRVVEGKSAPELKVRSDAAVKNINDLISMVKKMKRGDGGLGDMFHAEALKLSKKSRAKSLAAGAKNRVKYDPEKDAFIEMKSGEPAPFSASEKKAG